METPLFYLNRDVAEHLRAVGPFVAIWMVLFAAPLFPFTKDRPATGIIKVKLYDAGSSSLLRR